MERPGTPQESVLPGRTLEAQLQSKLDLSRVKRLRDPAKGRPTREVTIRGQEVSVIQQIEELSAELQAHAFQRQLKTLVRGKVQLIEVRTARKIAAGVPEGRAHRDLEGRGVQIWQPILRPSAGEQRIPNLVGTIVIRPAKILLNS